MTIQTQFILDDKGNKIAVVLPINEYEKLLEINNGNQSEMSNALKEGIEHALEQVEKSKTFSHEEVMKQTKERYPNFF